MTRSDSGSATHGRIYPSAFSSALSPGHSILYFTRPLTMRHMHSRHVPFLHELGRTKFESLADSINDLESVASNLNPVGSTTMEKGLVLTRMLTLSGKDLTVEVELLRPSPTA
jgi:hypothetical protein